jgi:hypothetical protein
MPYIVPLFPKGLTIRENSKPVNKTYGFVEVRNGTASLGSTSRAISNVKCGSVTLAVPLFPALLTE